MVESAAPAVQPFSLAEWKERRETLTADDLPRLQATIDGIGQTMQAQAAQMQPTLRLLAAFVLRCAVPLGPPEYELRGQFLAKVPKQFELTMQQTACGIKLAVVDKHPAKILVAAPDTKIIQGKF